MPAMNSNGAILYFFVPHERNIMPQNMILMPPFCSFLDFLMMPRVTLSELKRPA